MQEEKGNDGRLGLVMQLKLMELDAFVLVSLCLELWKVKGS